MRTLLSALLAAAIAVASCANQPEQPSTRPSPSVEAATPTEDVGAEIYAAVIRRLVTKDHTFGQGESPFKHVYVINGPIPDAGDPETVGDAFGPASEPFSSEVIAGIEEELKDLPPVTFIADGNDVRHGERGMGGVKNDGVIISLGPLERNEGRIHVSNRLWCGGLCAQWLTYVLAEDDGRWKITGTTGPVSIS